MCTNQNWMQKQNVGGFLKLTACDKNNFIFQNQRIYYCILNQLKLILVSLFDGGKASTRISDPIQYCGSIIDSNWLRRNLLMLLQYLKALKNTNTKN